MAKVIVQNLSDSKHVINVGDPKSPLIFAAKERKHVESSVADLVMASVHKESFEVMVPKEEKAPKAPKEDKKPEPAKA